MTRSSELQVMQATTRAQAVNPREVTQAEMPPIAGRFNSDGSPVRLTSYADERGIPRHNGYWPGFGWEGTCVDTAVSTDSPEAMRWCHDHGFIDHSTKTFYNTPLRALCEQRAPKCAAVLAKLGYPLAMRSGGSPDHSEVK